MASLLGRVPGARVKIDSAYGLSKTKKAGGSGVGDAPKAAMGLSTFGAIAE